MTMICISQRRKLRHSKINLLKQAASKWWRWDSNPDNLGL